MALSSHLRRAVPRLLWSNGRSLSTLETPMDSGDVNSVLFGVKKQPKQDTTSMGSSIANQTNMFVQEVRIVAVFINAPHVILSTSSASCFTGNWLQNSTTSRSPLAIKNGSGSFVCWLEYNGGLFFPTCFRLLFLAFLLVLAAKFLNLCCLFLLAIASKAGQLRSRGEKVCILCFCIHIFWPYCTYWALLAIVYSEFNEWDTENAQWWVGHQSTSNDYYTVCCLVCAFCHISVRIYHATPVWHPCFEVCTICFVL